jgi:acetate kinase
LDFIGMKIDPGLNGLPMTKDLDLATSQSQVRILAIHTKEEWQIARSCWRYLKQTE